MSKSTDSVSFTRVVFKNFKALGDYQISLQGMNLLVGPNNSGKSTVLSAFRTLDTALRKARSRKAENLRWGDRYGHRLQPHALPISFENIHTDYSEADSSIKFELSNNNCLTLLFPKEGGCFLLPETQGLSAQSPASFKKAFPIEIAVVPVLGPVDYREKPVDERTVKKGLSTHRASSHFRNYWLYNPEFFKEFRSLVQESWQGMDIEMPVHSRDYADPTLNMVCFEDRMARELFWSGFGFQVWCQLLTHIVRSKSSSIIVIDEPEIYLHPEIQRRLLNILRDLHCDVLLATHSSEMIGEADPSEILLVDKKMLTAKRLRDVESVQSALDAVGSIQNLTLAQLARNKRILFVEGDGDFRLLRKFAKVLGMNELSAGVGLTVIESGGFSSWERVKAFAWGIEKTLDSELRLAAIYDSDYWCAEQRAAVEEELKTKLDFAHVHSQKELENYLLVPTVLERATERLIRERSRRTGISIQEVPSIVDILLEITESFKSLIQAQYFARRIAFSKKSKQDDATLGEETLNWFDGKWKTLAGRLEISPGKKVPKQLRQRLSEEVGITLTESSIVRSFHVGEVPSEMVCLLRELEIYRISQKKKSPS